MREFFIIGMNHATAPVEVRERFAGLCVSGLPGADGRELEAVTVLTCNRAEAYFYGKPDIAQKIFEAWLNSENRSFAEIEPYTYRYHHADVIKHLFRVASGLDSMVLGENQIMHQIKASYQAAIKAGSVGKYLHALFQRALEVGKRARAETRISENAVSIASVAVEMAQSIFGPLDTCTAMVVGAGEMASIVARQMHDRGVKNLLFANRTKSRAEELARQYHGRAASLDELPELLEQTDVLITSTGAPRPIITKKLFEDVMPRRFGRPIFAIDIAVPRDIEPECANLENVFLYDIDDLQNVVDESFELRRQESSKVEAIVDYEVMRFMQTLESWNAAPLITAIRQIAENIRRSEVDRIFPPSRCLSDELRADIERLSRGLMGKWLHPLMVNLKQNSPKSHDELEFLARLFGLDSNLITEENSSEHDISSYSNFPATDKSTGADLSANKTNSSNSNNLHVDDTAIVSNIAASTDIKN